MVNKAKRTLFHYGHNQVLINKHTMTDRHTMELIWTQTRVEEHRVIIKLKINTYIRVSFGLNRVSNGHTHRLQKNIS